MDQEDSRAKWRYLWEVEPSAIALYTNDDNMHVKVGSAGKLASEDQCVHDIDRNLATLDVFGS